MTESAPWYVRLIKTPAGASLLTLVVVSLVWLLLTGVLRPSDLHIGGTPVGAQTMPLSDGVKKQLDEQATTMSDLQRRVAQLDGTLSAVQASQNRIEDRMDRFFVRMESLASRR